MKNEINVKNKRKTEIKNKWKIKEWKKKWKKS